MKKSQEKHFGIKNRCFLWAKGLAICFFAIFLMSHNVSAFTVTDNASFSHSYNSLQWRFHDNVDNISSWANAQVDRSNSDRNITLVDMRPASGSDVSDISKGNYIVVQSWVLFNTFNNSGNLNTFGGFWGMSNVQGNCDIVDQEVIYQDYSPASGGAGVNRFMLETTCVMLEDDPDYISMNFFLRSNLTSVSGTNSSLRFNSLFVYKPNSEKEEEAANENIEQNEQDSNASSTDAANASQSLISAIGGFVSSITSASPSNCNINGNMGNFDLGNIDLCANPVPSYIQIISSFILISLCIPFAIVMFNRFISLFRSFQT